MLDPAAVEQESCDRVRPERGCRNEDVAAVRLSDWRTVDDTIAFLGRRRTDAELQEEVLIAVSEHCGGQRRSSGRGRRQRSDVSARQMM